MREPSPAATARLFLKKREKTAVVCRILGLLGFFGFAWSGNALANSPPVITWGGKPGVIREMDRQQLAVIASDPDNDTLSYTWKIMSADEGLMAKARFFDTAVNGTGFGITQASDPNSAASIFNGKTVTVRCTVSDGSQSVFTEWVFLVQGNNRPPVAIIEGILGSPTQRLRTGEAIVPDANKSYDPDGANPSFQWFIGSRSGGNICGILFGTGMNGPSPGLYIPEMSADIDQILELRYIDGLHVTVKQVTAYLSPDSTPCASGGGGGGGVGNRPPVVSAGADQNAGFDQTVTLNGSFSDPDGDPPNDITWEEVSGSPVILSNKKVLRPTFRTPTAPCATCGEFRFRLTGTDGKGGSHSDETVVRVSGSGGSGGSTGGLEDLPGCNGTNQRAQDNAGADREANGGVLVAIEGSGSDPDNTETIVAGVVVRGITYKWEVLNDNGLHIELQNSNTRTVSFTAPQASQKTTVELGLSVKDPLGCGTRDRVNVTIKGANM